MQPGIAVAYNMTCNIGQPQNLEEVISSQANDIVFLWSLLKLFLIYRAFSALDRNFRMLVLSRCVLVSAACVISFRPEDSVSEGKLPPGPVSLQGPGRDQISKTF